MATLSKNDKGILSLKKEVEEKKKALKASEKFSPITNCSLYIENKNYNLNVLDKEQICYLIGLLRGLKDNCEKELTSVKDFKLSGFYISEWISDLKAKYSNLDRKLEEERLKALEKRLHTLLSTDTKVSLELDEIKSQI